VEGVYDAVLLPYKSGSPATGFAALAVLPVEGGSVEKTLEAMAATASNDANAPQANVRARSRRGQTAALSAPCLELCIFSAVFAAPCLQRPACSSRGR